MEKSYRESQRWAGASKLPGCFIHTDFSFRINCFEEATLLETISSGGTFTHKDSFKSMMARLIQLKLLILQRRKLGVQKR